MAELLVVQSKVRQIAKKNKLRLAGDAVKQLSKCVECCISEAGKRAKANRRQTIKAIDF